MFSLYSKGRCCFILVDLGIFLRMVVVERVLRHGLVGVPAPFLIKEFQYVPGTLLGGTSRFSELLTPPSPPYPPVLSTAACQF